MLNPSYKKSALITGASGFIGKNLLRRLLDDGWSLKLLVRNREKFLQEEVVTVKELPYCNIIVADINDSGVIINAVTDVSVIFHCAANVNTWDSWDSYYKVNVLGVKNLVKAIKLNNPNLARLLHISSVDVYGFPDFPCTEEMLSFPGKLKSSKNYYYGKSKLLGETFLKKYCSENNIPYTILRPTNVIGPGSQFIERIGHELKSGLMLKINHGESNCGFLYVDNLIDYMLWAVKSSVANKQCYNVCDNNNVTWAEFISYFKNKINGRGMVINLPYKVASICASICEYAYKIFVLKKEPLLHRMLVDIFGKTCGHTADKIRRDSGISSRIDFKTGMDIAIETSRCKDAVRND